ncbi:MAG: hypothetical protein Q8K82_03245 [Gemmatimonadaceae bacterium]|nr:hypothetical protein [Gemmatimonadaceae bacterium]
MPGKENGTDRGVVVVQRGEERESVGVGEPEVDDGEIGGMCRDCCPRFATGGSPSGEKPSDWKNSTIVSRIVVSSSTTRIEFTGGLGANCR